MGWSATDPTGSLEIFTSAAGETRRPEETPPKPLGIWFGASDLVENVLAERARCAALVRAAGCNCGVRLALTKRGAHFDDCPEALAAAIEALP